MKNEEIKYSSKKLQDALNRLEDAIKEKDSTLAVDATIQRFEFTFELAWKTLKRILYQEGIVALSPKEVLKESFKLGYIRDEHLWLKMLSDRNSMSHTYNEEHANQVYASIPDYFVGINDLCQTINNLITALD